MTLASGAWLGPYEILSPLGAGGMGEVYRARDSRLERDVAIKVLPASFSNDADRLRRFEQEAKAAGLLNHPNIIAVYDVGTHEGAPYVVQELLEGETLRALLSGAKPSPHKAIDYALQMALGLAAAHEKRIVHRDLKPENLFVTKDGRIKILDFGLAKLTRAEDGNTTPSDDTTGTAGTQPGVVLGTLGYMSPEQVRGQPADSRSDIFSFGAVLYEMLSGLRAFRGGSAADTMSAILREEPPDLTAMNPNISAGLERIVRHCLEKTAEQRFQSARDLAFDLEGASGNFEKPGAPAASPSLAGSSRGHPVYRRLTFRRGSIVSARFSDSQTIVYCARWEGASREMFAMRLDGPESRPLGPPNALMHAVSPSSEIALVLGAERPLRGVARGVLARMPLDGGAPREILEDVLLADWLPDGSDLAVVRVVDGRPRLDFPIGQGVYEPSGWISSLRVSPSGDLVAFIDHPSVDDLTGSVVVADRERRIENLSGLWNSAHGVAWSPGGEEIWFTASNRGVDQSLHSVTRQRRERLVEQVPGGLFLHDISRNGSVLLSHTVSRAGVLCRIAGEPEERELSWFDHSNRPDLSSDGSTVLFSEEGAGAGPLLAVYLRKTDGSPAIRLGEGEALALSPDGRWALSVPVSLKKLLLIPTGAGQTRELVHEGFTYHHIAAWFPDGRRILFAASREGRRPRSYVQDLDGTGASPVTPEGTIAHAISPDSRFIVAGNPVLKMYPVEGGEAMTIPGALPGDVPIRWHEDGRSLFVRSGYLPAKVSRLDIATGLREPFLELMPSDPSGVVGITGITLTPDARSYAYSYARRFSDLYLVEGLQ